MDPGFKIALECRTARGSPSTHGTEITRNQGPENRERKEIGSCYI
jgi:hypothetical protein